MLGDGPEATAILRHLQNQVRETAGAAHFSTGYSDGAHLILHSERRVDGVLLDALIGAEPKSDLIPKLVRGLLSPTRRRPLDGQENAFVLLALDRYFNTYEKATPDFLARAWLGPSAGEHRFKGRTTRQSLTLRQHADLLKAGAADLVLAKDGPVASTTAFALAAPPSLPSYPPSTPALSSSANTKPSTIPTRSAATPTAPGA